MLDLLPIWALGALVFSLRVIDVSLGTLRTISVVHGRLRLAVGLGFFEILLWVTAVSQVILRIRESPLLVLAYAGGFATGNALGILLEKKIRLGRCVVRMITHRGEELVEALRPFGDILGAFRSEIGRLGTVLVIGIFPRRDLDRIVRLGRRIDSELVYVVERFSETGHISPPPHPTGWRAVFKKK